MSCHTTSLVLGTQPPTDFALFQPSLRHTEDDEDPVKISSRSCDDTSYPLSQPQPVFLGLDE
jgi:hypothetical protein